MVGAGFTGLWTALLAKQADPGRDVVLVEGGRAADGATGRNGGFVSASLTHGFANGMERWPAEMPTLLRMGRDNLDAIEKAVGDLGIDCDFVRTGELDVAVEPYQVDGLREHAAEAAAMGEDVSFLDRGAGTGSRRLARVPGRQLRRRRGRPRRPGATGLGPAPCVPRGRRAAVRAHADRLDHQP